MKSMAMLLASCAGIGYVKGGGTIAAAAYTLAWYFTSPGQYLYVQFVVLLVMLAVGVWSANKMEQFWGKDSHRVVIDEAAGMCITLLWMPHQWQYALAGLAAFRFFDIAKPLFIRKLEQWPGGWGVMADDVLAGIYAQLLLQVVKGLNLI